MAVTSNPAPVAHTSQNALHALLCEVLPPQGAWSDDAYLWLTDHSNRLIELTDGLVEELPVPTFTHQAVPADADGRGRGGAGAVLCGGQAVMVRTPYFGMFRSRVTRMRPSAWDCATRKRSNGSRWCIGSTAACSAWW